MNIVSSFEMVGFLAMLYASFLVLSGRHNIFSGRTQSIFCGLILLTLLSHILSTVEWINVPETNDVLSDFMEMLLPVTWILFFYSYLQDMTDTELGERDRALKTLMGNLPGMVYRCRNDRNWTMDFVSNGCLQLTGYQPADIVASAKRSYGDLIHPDDRDMVWEKVQEAVRNRTVFQLVYRIETARGDEKWVWEQGCGVFSNGDMVSLEGFIMDITERKKAEEKIHESEQRFRYLLSTSPSIIYSTDLDNTACTFVSENLYENMGYRPEEMMSDPQFWFDRIHPDDVSDVIAGVKRSIKKGRGKLQYRFRHKDGKYRWIYDSHRVVYDDTGKAIEFVGAWTDVTHTRRLSDKVSYQQRHDLLTNLLNRYGFERSINHFLIDDRTESTQHILCVLDIDQFKTINDVYGQKAGDELLRQFGQSLHSRIRRDDILGRLGGDEFGIFLTDTSADKAERIVEQWMAHINKFRFEWGDRKHSITVSAGLAPLNSTVESIETVLGRANIACSIAKEKGGNCSYVYQASDEKSGKMHDEMTWVNRIKQALDEDRFCLYWQPITLISGKSRNYPHYEILIRMQDKEEGLIAPGRFLMTAEKYGLSAKIDLWVVNRVFNMMKQYPERFNNIDTCAINLSGQSMGNRELLNFITSRLEKNEAPAQKICFEITETAVIQELSTANEFIQALRQFGCKFSLDDFGTGLSSFAYLRDLPVDYLKIDGTFVRNIVDDPIDFALVKSINEIGHVMGKKTIAEFVENDDILAKLGSIGVNYAQGFGIGKPVPVEEDRLITN